MRDNSDKKRVVFRADVSARIGTGHLRRCIALGKYLFDAGIGVHFLARGQHADCFAEAGQFAEANVQMEPATCGLDDAIRTVEYCRDVGADRLVVDHYDADEAYQRVLADARLRWMQFDGAAAMPLWADWIVSTSPAANEATYRPLQRRTDMRLLLGPRYAVLREEFGRIRKPRCARDAARRLLLTFGGGDDRGATLFCLRELSGMNDFEMSIFASSYGPQVGAIRHWMQSHPDVPSMLFLDDPQIARHMADADIAITAGGTTTFELATLGVPALILQIAENQRGNAESWDRLGVAVNLGSLEELNAEALRHQLAALAGDQARRQEMMRVGQSSVDGGGAERLARELFPDI
jgi:UDP-2,4-diacetamido-2,4,6-trideoxy-beta-L-altropyranose hydrolase